MRLAVAPAAADIPDYDRGEWRHWNDVDRDCQNARQEVLIEESTTPVTFKSDERCRVATGNWTGPYTGTEVDDPSRLDVDHMVPLANAHRSGGWAWDRDRKAAFANDLEFPGHLIATTASANRAKGADGPEDWRPPDRGYWCKYATDWITIKDRWELTATEREFQALEEMLATCGSPASVEPDYLPGSQDGSAPSGPIETPTDAPTMKEPTPIVGGDRNCGDFSTWREAQDFFEAKGGPAEDPHDLDRDGDGNACGSLPGSQDGSAPAGPIETPTDVPTMKGTTPSVGGDRNCGDFSTWREAQDFFEAKGGPAEDPHDLDRDGDGNACGSLPGAP